MHVCDVEGCPRNTQLLRLNDRWLCFMHHNEATGHKPECGDARRRQESRQGTQTEIGHRLAGALPRGSARILPAPKILARI